MQVNVKLFSVLRQYCPGYDPEKGVDLELPAGATVAQMLARLSIPHEKAPVVACDGIILKAGDLLSEGGRLQVFQPVGGG
ncbi:MAG: MoaD/ThiS family protein [Desulfosarcinaceae bacterium]